VKRFVKVREKRKMELGVFEKESVAWLQDSELPHCYVSPPKWKLPCLTLTPRLAFGLFCRGRGCGERRAGWGQQKRRRVRHREGSGQPS
jgi:hypothetical protein